MPKDEDYKLPSKDEVIEKYKDVIDRNKAHAKGEKSKEELLEEETKNAANKLKNQQANDLKAEKEIEKSTILNAKTKNSEMKNGEKVTGEQQKSGEQANDKDINKTKRNTKSADKEKKLNKSTSKDPKVTQQETPKERKYTVVNDQPAFSRGAKGLKQKQKYQYQLTNKYSKRILLDGEIVSTQDYKPNLEKHIIELKGVRKSYQTGDLETPILKGIDIVLDKKDFIVILGPSGSGKTTFLNVISGLDKTTEGDVFILGSNLSLLKDSHLTKFRRRNVGFIFQQYNLLTNLTAKENAEVGQNLANKNKKGLSIEEIFETIGMTDQINKYPHQMSGGQQQRVSIARALAKNPEILFADEPTGALDEEMGRKVLEILVKVNKEYHTTIVVVTHNPNIAKIANTIIHIKNGLIDSLEKNPNPADPQTIDWS